MRTHGLALQRQARPPGDDLVVGIFRPGIGRHMLLDIRACIPPRDIQLLEIGHVNHRPHADIVLHQGDVDRKFIVPFDKFDRPVERVDQPVELPVAALVVEHLAPLLAQDRDARRAQVFADGFVRQPVGERDRRLVVFEAYIVIVEVFIDIHYRGSGPDCRIDERRQQVHPHLVVYHRSSSFEFGNFGCHGKGNKNL